MLFRSYDDLIENNTRRIQILEKMAQAIYREWFVNFRFPGHEKVKLVDSPMGKIPEGWRVSSFGEVSLNFDNKRRPLSSIERSRMKGQYPYYGAAKVFDFVDAFIFEGKYLLIAEDGSVITPQRKPVLQLTDGKFWPNNHTHVVLGRPPVSTDFLYLMMSDVDVSGYITGAAQPKITQANLNRIPVRIPTGDMLRRFDVTAGANIELMQRLERKNANLRRTRDLLLPQLVSGALNVAAMAVESP